MSKSSPREPELPAQPNEVDVLMAESMGWKPIEVQPATDVPHDGPPDDKTRLRRRLVNHLLDVQLSQHLLMVSGLGTSRCVVNDEGDKPAPTMNGLWQAVSEAAGPAFAEVISKVKFSAASQDIEALLSRCHLYQELTPDLTIGTFIEVAERVIATLCRAVTGPWPLPLHETFIRRLTSRPTRLPRFKLFTTNYDLCWERAASHVKAVIIDGFTHADPQEFDGECFSYDVVLRRDGAEGPEYIPKVFHLGKLHGSIDWQQEIDGRVVKARSDRPVMIYPRNNKYQLSYNQPFLELMARFQQALRTPNTGIIIAGFGFNDEHLAQPIISAISSNPSIRLVVVDPGLKAPDRGRPGYKHIEFIGRLVREGDKRIALVNATFEQYVSLMPELSVVAEADAHKQRLEASRR